MASIVLSSFALAVSVTTLYLTFFRRGHLRATRPTVIYLGQDGVMPNGPNKVYLRTLLYSTSRRGHVIESMYVNVRRGETSQNFSIWVLGEDRLERGSGLFVGPEGVAINHHFVLPPDGSAFSFVSGDYELRLFAQTAGRRLSELLFQRVSINEVQAKAIGKGGTCGLYFDWGPDQQTYHSHVRDRLTRQIPDDVLDGGA